MKRGPAVILVPTQHMAIVLDAEGWHMRAVPPQWWLDEHEARHELDIDAARAKTLPPCRVPRRQPRRLTRAQRRRQRVPR